jgi:hypothetical protein
LNLPPELAAMESRLASEPLPPLAVDRDRLFYRCGYAAGWRDGHAARSTSRATLEHDSSSRRDAMRRRNLAGAVVAAMAGFGFLWWQTGALDQSIDRSPSPPRSAASQTAAPSPRLASTLPMVHSVFDRRLQQRYGAQMLVRREFASDTGEPAVIDVDELDASAETPPARPPATIRGLRDELLTS